MGKHNRQLGANNSSSPYIPLPPPTLHPLFHSEVNKKIAVIFCCCFAAAKQNIVHRRSRSSSSRKSKAEKQKKRKSLKKNKGKRFTSNNSNKNAIKMTSESNFRAAAVDNGTNRQGRKQGRREEVTGV